MVEEKDLTYSDPQPTSTKAKKKPFWILVLAVVLVISIFAVKDNWGGITDILDPPETPPVVHNLTKADVALYKFDSLSSNKSTNVELWLMNIGEKTATNISVFVRVRSNNGTILFEDNVSASTLILRGNETCIADYTVNFSLKTKQLYHTIEVSWDSGRHTYTKNSP